MMTMFELKMSRIFFGFLNLFEHCWTHLHGLLHFPPNFGVHR